jgi:thiamine-phosphate pyrophosphorylase
MTGAATVTRVGRLRLPTLCFITDRRRCDKQPIETMVDEAIKGGANVIQLREKDLPAGELFALAMRLHEVTRNRAILVINDRLDVNLAVGTDGVHLPENGLPVSIARSLLGQHTLIGCSVHSEEAAVEAERGGADYVQIGTIYATESKPDAEPAGPDLVRKVSSALTIPVLAVGGVGAKNAGEVIEAGASGASVISAILGASEPEAATRQLVEAMSEAWQKRPALAEQEETEAAKPRKSAKPAKS